MEKTRLTAWTLHPREMTRSLEQTSKQQNRETEQAFSMTVMHLYPVDPTMSHADPNASSGTNRAHISYSYRANYAMVHCGLLVYIEFNPPQLRTRRAMNVIRNTVVRSRNHCCHRHAITRPFVPLTYTSVNNTSIPYLLA